MIELNSIWREYASLKSNLVEKRPDFKFDPQFYKKQISAQTDDPAELRHHYESQGRAEGYLPNLYARISSQYSSIGEVLADIVTDSSLTDAIAAGQDGAEEFAFELIHLGDPVDARISDFSCESYLRMHPDILRAGVDPLVHYLSAGFGEGREILRNIRKGQYEGSLPYRPHLPTCLIAVHELSRTGAPIVGRDLAREAAKTHNVIVSALRDGLLLDDFKETSCLVLISPSPYQNFNIYTADVLKKIDFAIVNSAIAWQYIPFLVAKEIPFAGYLHEYSEYLHPAFHFNLFPMLSDLLIFSSEHVRDSWRGRMADVNFDITNDSTIIPQRPLLIGDVSAEEQTEARARLSELIGRDLSKARIVCGAGQPHWRKGTDIFAMAAQICRPRDEDTVFIWIGHSVVPDELTFGTYIAYHFNRIDIGAPESNFFFIPAGPAYFDVLTTSDVMFMSSRLDPLPNVVFDALKYGCQIVQFEGASGFGDETYEDSGRIHSVQYGNPEAAVTRILSLPRKEQAEALPEQPAFNLFKTIQTTLKARLDSQRYFVRGASQIDVPIMYTPDPEFDGPRAREREKMLQYGRRRVWRDLEDIESHIAASDNWTHSQTRLAPYATVSEKTLPHFSLHIHAYYTDDLARDLSDFAIYRHARRIVVTTDTEAKAGGIRKIMAAEGLVPEVILGSNTGRDILPFMNLFLPGGASDRDEFWCHLHQKKSIGSTDGGDLWRKFLMRILLGDEESISNALETLAQDGVGLVAPLDPHFVGWNESRHLLPKFAGRLPGPMPRNPLLFPVGNMFWTRRSVVQAMNDVFGPDYPWPDEPIANDGTEFHLIERLWPAMAASLNLDSVFVHKLDEKRI